MKIRLIICIVNTLSAAFILALCLVFGGCAHTSYKATLPDGSTKSLTATSFLVKRDLGKVILGADSLDGSRSDQMAVAAEALALAAKVLVKP
jgi:hypothetical protein